MEISVILTGNPNVGKSTVFNRLTGLKQHTGNWSGKTVEKKEGILRDGGDTFRVVDLPGAYSLTAHSPEEEVTRDCLTNGLPDGAVVTIVCDGGALERNLMLCCEVLSITRRVVVCVNLMDEAARRGIFVDGAALAAELGCPVVLCAARSGDGIAQLIGAIRDMAKPDAAVSPVSDKGTREAYAARAQELAGKVVTYGEPTRWRACGGECTSCKKGRNCAVQRCGARMPHCADRHPDRIDRLPDRIDRGIDRVLTGRWTAFPCMVFFLFILFWLTLVGAGCCTTLLERGFAALLAFCAGHSAWLPETVRALVLEGILQTTCTVIAVMLPPMAIFFPLFSLLEDAGFLPRLAFNTDRLFAACGVCGKQCLTMMMGFGCNAVGVTGCRIIDAPRERRIAMLTNAFVPCNGRFPMVLTLVSVLCRGAILSAAGFVGCLALSLLVTLAVSRWLSGTMEESASFAMELPPYRMPQIGQTLWRAVTDRIVFVLGRAAAVAAPAGAVLWLMGEVCIGGASLFVWLIRLLEPIGRLFGMDGVILSGFVLSLPAAEIFYPLVLDGYAAMGIPFSGAADWSGVTALCVLLFTLFHFPCATTLWTIRRESGSTRDMLRAAAIPTVIGLFLCWLVGLNGG